MTEMLHWAIEHSDPDRIKELMEKYKETNLTIKDVYGQDVLDAMFADEELRYRCNHVKQMQKLRKSSVL